MGTGIRDDAGHGYYIEVVNGNPQYFQWQWQLPSTVPVSSESGTRSVFRRCRRATVTRRDRHGARAFTGTAHSGWRGRLQLSTQCSDSSGDITN